MITIVTGASGHVGNNLVRRLLSEGRQVHVLIHRNASTFDGLNIEKVRGDVCDVNSLKAAFAGADIVYHLAARVSIETRGWTRFMLSTQ